MTESTPINPSTAAAGATGKRWAEVLNSVDKTRPIALFAHHYADTGSNKEPSVLLGRSWDVQLKVPMAIWEKQYPKLAGPNDLSCFNQHEKNMLALLSRMPHCAQFVDFRDVGSSSLFVSGQGLQASTSIPMLRTRDMGTSLKQWVKWGFTHHSKPYKHLFHLPAHYLHFARGALIALNEVHSTGMVQCDGNQGNWCIDTHCSPLSGTDEGVCIEPLWERVSIIDVGYAIHPSYPPPKMLPLGANGMAPVMVKATEKIEGIARHAFNSLSEPERQAGGWPSASTAMQDLGFWTRHAPDATAHYGLVDWRQDYWWLGQVLQELRKDGDNALWHANPAILSLIGSEEYPATGLAHELMLWGQTELPYDQEPDASKRRTLAQEKRKEIHQSLLQRLDAAMAQLTPRDGARTITLYRADFDAQYASASDIERKAIAENERRIALQREAETRKARERAEKMRAWVRRAVWLAGAGVGIAALAWFYLGNTKATVDPASATLRALAKDHGDQKYRLQLSPDKSSYAVGQHIRFTVQSPRDGYLTLFVKSTDPSVANELVLALQNQPVSAQVLSTVPAETQAAWPVRGPAGTAQLVGVVTAQKVSWSNADRGAAMALGPGTASNHSAQVVRVDGSSQTTEGLRKLFGCPPQPDTAQPARPHCQAAIGALSNYAASDVLTVHIRDAQTTATPTQGTLP